MKLHPKIKMIAEEFGESYEWSSGDESLFIKVANHFIDIVKERLSAPRPSRAPRHRIPPG